MSTYETIAKIIGEKMDMDPSEITETSTFESLSIDSLDMVEIVMDLEEAFEIEMEETEELKSIQDLIKYIDDKKA